MILQELTQQIKEYANRLGFDACGICKADYVGDKEAAQVEEWLAKGYSADMHYMQNHLEKRCNPTRLVAHAKSIICVALNYYPAQKQDTSAPQIAYYAYGKDYHAVMKDKLTLLLSYIQSTVPTTTGRAFCDTAPILERYWAWQAGIGFVGKNSLLIIPKRGSYFFLGELIIDIELAYDKPLTLSCGTCTRCLEACPTQAIVTPTVIDSARCISYQTIENRGTIREDIKSLLGNRFYGCDACQQVCPWNKFATAHATKEFVASSEVVALDFTKLEAMTVEQYQVWFKDSAIKRAKYAGLKRNMDALNGK